MPSNIQKDLLTMLSFPVPLDPSNLYIGPLYDPVKHVNPKTHSLLAPIIHQAAQNHQARIDISTPLQDREIELLKKRNWRSDGLSIKIETNPQDKTAPAKITIFIDYNKDLSKQIFVAPKLLAEQPVQVDSHIQDAQARLNRRKDLEITVKGESIMSINYAQFVLLTKGSPIENAVNDEKFTCNEKGIMKIDVPEFNEYPEKVKPFMKMVLNQSVPSNLTIEDTWIYLDWAGMMGATNTEAALLNALVANRNLEEYCATKENREVLRAFSQNATVPKEVRKFIQEYVFFYGNTHFDKLSVTERKELEIVNHPFYHGNISADQAGNTLRDPNKSPPTEDGLHYLLRESSVPKSYTLSVLSRSNSIKNYRFSINTEGELVDDDAKKCKTLNDFIQAVRISNK